MSRPLRVRVNGEAWRYIGLLQDYGHLDDDAADQLVLLLADMLGREREQVADLQFVRRVAAALLFDQAGHGEQPQELLEEDWPLLFH